MIVVVGGQWCHFPPGGALHLPLHPHRTAGSKYFCALFFVSVYLLLVHLHSYKFNIQVLNMIRELKCHLVQSWSHCNNIASNQDLEY